MCMEWDQWGRGSENGGPGSRDAKNGYLDQLGETQATWLPQPGAGVRSSQRQAAEQELKSPWVSIVETT